LVLAILVVLVVQFAFSVKIEERIVKNTADDAAMELAARGAQHLAAALFRDDRANGVPKGDIDTLADIWCDPNTEEQRTFQVGDVQVVLVVEDLERRLPLAWLANEERAEMAEKALARLIETLAPMQGVEGAAAAKVIAERVRELEQATAQAAPGSPASRRFYGLEQLLELGESLDRRILYGDPDVDPPTEGIAPYVTTWPVEKLNINTVLGPVLWAVLPEKNKADQSLHDEAEDIVKKIREYRVDPDYAASGAMAGAGAGAAGEQGASRKWAGTPFEKVDDLESGQIHALLGSIFTAPQPQPGAGGTPPPPSPSPSPSPSGQGASGDPEFKELLTVQSNWFMIRVDATKQSEDEIVEEEEEGAAPPASEFRMLVYRNAQDELTVLFMGESPR
jgi:type II secretory pathway component PulK